MKKSAFTLVELMVAMAIIGVLLGLAIYGVTAAQRAQRNTERKAAAQDINVGIQGYIDSFGTYPAGIHFITDATGGSGHAYVRSASGATCPAQPNAVKCKDVPLKGAANPVATYYNDTTTQTTTSKTRYHFEICPAPQSGYILTVELEGGEYFFASNCAT